MPDSEKRPRILRPEIEAGRRLIVISDVHGNLPYLRGVLEKAGFGGDDLILFLGDFLEKGPESLSTLHAVMGLCQRGQAIALMGNCDDWAAIFSDDDGGWGKNPLSYMQWRKCGLLWDMALALGEDPAQLRDFAAFRDRIGKRFPDEFAFLAGLPHAMEAGHYVFAHAGLRPGIPLEEQNVRELLKCDAFYRRGYSFDKWAVVGHYPVVLYGDEIVCANPLIDRQRHIVNLDGGCVLKDDGQLNALLISDLNRDEFTWTAYDPFPLARVKEEQAASARSAYIRWGDSKVEVLERGEEFSHCRHVRTGYELDILTRYLFEDGRYTNCNDCTDYVLPLQRGDTVSVVETCSRGYFVKHEGVSGWYFGELERR